MMARRAALTIALVLSTIGALVACSGGEPTTAPTPSSTPAAPASTTPPEPTTDDTAAAAVAFRDRLVAAVLDAGSVTFTQHTTTGAGTTRSVVIDLVLRESDDRVHERQESPDGTSETIVVDERRYVRNPAAGDDLFSESAAEVMDRAAREWLVVQVLGLAAILDAEPTGATQSLDGVTVTEHRVQIEYDPYGELDDVLEARLWVDDQDRLRLMTLDYEENGAPVQVEMTLTGWGEPKDITAPDPALVAPSS